jgi:trehalose-phosphatase
LRHLLQCWDELGKRVSEATQILLFLDYDGTLTPIATRPEMAVLSPQTRKLLKQISHDSLFRVAIITGRSLSEIKTLVGLKDIAYAGNHGLEVECPPCPHTPQGRHHKTTTFVHPIAKEFEPGLERLEQRLAEALTGVDGVLIENKGLTLSIHYRLAKQQAAAKQIRRLLFQALECENGTNKWRVTTGKKVFELRPPVEWNKGKAIEWLLEIYGTPGSLPVFAGDDLTDEDGFQVLHRVGGVSIFVGQDSGSSTADYYLESPEQLRQWLEKLLEGR